jgi:hypothetical protein
VGIDYSVRPGAMMRGFSSFGFAKAMIFRSDSVDFSIPKKPC